MIETTLGQLLVNEALPEDMRDYNRTLDSKALNDLLKDVARKHPDKYRDVTFKLNQIGQKSAQAQGGLSFGIEHLATAKAALGVREKIQAELRNILADNSLSDEERAQKIILATGKHSATQIDDIYREALENKNPIALQIKSGSRGKPMNLASLIGSDMLYADHRDEVIPIPILRSYSEGLSPEEYWAGTYGARKGILATKFCLAKGTLVRMADLTVKPIEQVQIGDSVLGADRLGNTFPVEVSNTFDNGLRECHATGFKHKEQWCMLYSTLGHKILCSTASLMYDGAFEILPAATVSTLFYAAVKQNTETVLFERASSHALGLQPTYDLEVDHPDHLFVLANGMIVSNSTQNSGYLSKQLVQAAHRLAVVDEDEEEDPEAKPLTRGLVVDTDDMDNEGALLAKDTGPYKRNTPLTPKILNYLKRTGVDRILVRSPAVGGSPEGGVYARDVGIRERGALPGRGELVGMQAAQAISEPLSQSMLSAKHSGGIAGQEKSVGGFEYINQLVQVPKQLKGGATHVTKDGIVQRIEPAPAGGHYVYVDGTKHFVPEDLELKVKKGDTVEAGDSISEGIPNPAIITQYKGVGEGRRYFVNELRKTMKATGLNPHRRNIELLARGLINHVRLTEEMGDHVPDDVVPYSTLEHTYQPREGFQTLNPKQAVGQYLERPVLHYSIGAKIRPSMLKDLEYFGVNEVDVHKNPPPFEPAMIRGMSSLQNDPDWLVQMYGSGLKKSLTNSTARGAISEERGSSFVPTLAQGANFGNEPDRVVVKPKQPYAAPKLPEPNLDDSILVKASFDLASDKLLQKAPSVEGLGLKTQPKPLTEAVSVGAPKLDKPALSNPASQPKAPTPTPATAAGVASSSANQTAGGNLAADTAVGLGSYALTNKAMNAAANKVSPNLFANAAATNAAKGVASQPKTWGNLIPRTAKSVLPGLNVSQAANTVAATPPSLGIKSLAHLGAYTAFNGIGELVNGGIGLGANALAETLPEGSISPETREYMRNMGWNQEAFNREVDEGSGLGGFVKNDSILGGINTAIHNPFHTMVNEGQSVYEIGKRLGQQPGQNLADFVTDTIGPANSEVDNWNLSNFRKNIGEHINQLGQSTDPVAKARADEYSRLAKHYDDSNSWLSMLSLQPVQFKNQLEKLVSAKKQRIFQLQQQLQQPNLDPTVLQTTQQDLAALQQELQDYRTFGT